MNKKIDRDALLELPVLPKLAKLGIEMDQRLFQAWSRASKYPDSGHATGPYITDDFLIAELLRLNPKCARLFDIARFLKDYPWDPEEGWSGPVSADEVLAAGAHFMFFEMALDLTFGRTLTAGAYVKWIIDQCIAPTIIRPTLADRIAELLYGDWEAKINTPQGKKFLGELASLALEPDDFQYIMTFQGDKVVFRIVTALRDYYQRNADGVDVPIRALATHFGRIGLFSEQEIQELEDLVNSNAKESSFQKFFEAHPHFLRQWDYRAVHPQVYLTSEENAPLIPDFILTNNEIQRATIIDLKRPASKLIRQQPNRVRFADAIMEARAQLLTYRRFFEDSANRNRMRDRLKMEIYHPHLAVIIGRSSEFSTPLSRQKLTAETPDLEVVTYDDILLYAKNRRAVIEL